MVEVIIIAQIYQKCGMSGLFDFFLPADLKFRSMLLTFVTFGFLPFVSFATYPLIIEHYLERFVFNFAATRWDLGFHYNALLSPIMFLAALDVLQRIQNHKKLKKILSLWALSIIGIVFFLHRFYLHGPLMLATHPTFYEQTQRAVFLKNFVDQIPRKGLLMTQNNLATHFTHGNIVLLNSNIEKVKPDVIAVDIRPGQNANNFFPLTPAEFDELVVTISQNLNYERIEIIDSQLIFTRKKQE